MRTGVLVVGKAPVPGQAKTRLAATVGHDAAAEIAAASLLDTIDVIESYPRAERRMMALSGDLARAPRSGELRSRLQSWRIIPQRGSNLGVRLSAAHSDACAEWGTDAVIVQVGTDTPQLTGDDLDALVDPLDCHRGAALGLAADGGWWGIATARAGFADGLARVPMSTPRTGRATVKALRDAGATVAVVHVLTDLDTWRDALEIVSMAPHSRAAHVVRRIGRGMPAGAVR
jgi:glycosyltransferase A (GT-A) superfamily protein (DUF2064 family)